METPETDLARALRQLALHLGDALDGGTDHRQLLVDVTSHSTGSLPGDLVEDALLAAGQLLAGVDPHLVLLCDVWGDLRLRAAVEQLSADLRTDPRG